MKRYILFAGVNGAGKTTLYQTNDDYIDMPRINMDEIVRGFGSWRVAADVSKALDAELEKGYADMEAGRTKPAAKVFANIRKDYNV